MLLYVIYVAGEAKMTMECMSYASRLWSAQVKLGAKALWKVNTGNYKREAISIVIQN